jgi:L-2-hydroxyglutarate oxidase LhgO
MNPESGVTRSVDAVIIGGGFYGCAIAVYLAEQRGLRNILLAERATGLLTRASYNNQARVHNGYHYPRSFTTAYRSRVNLPRFVRDHPAAIKKDFTKLYAIAQRNSKVSARQFVRFCREIGARLEPADISFRQMFEPRLIEDIFVVEEYAFDTAALAKAAAEELDRHGVDVSIETTVTNIATAQDGGLQVVLMAPDGDSQTVTSR